MGMVKTCLNMFKSVEFYCFFCLVKKRFFLSKLQFV